MKEIPSLTELMEAGVHFGHTPGKWHPKMEPFIFTERGGVHIINLEETRERLKQALAFLQARVAEGAVVLFVGTKKQAGPLIEAAAQSCGMPYVTGRWLGGLITNFSEIKRTIKRYKELKAGKESGEWTTKYVKKEQVRMDKQLQKMHGQLQGIATLERIPDILFLTDMRGEKTAAREAARKGVKVVAICDTNIDPSLADYIIPGNDDAVRSIGLITSLVTSAVAEGAKEHVRVQAEKGAAKAAATAAATAAAAAAASSAKSATPVIKPAASSRKPLIEAQNAA